MNRTQIYLNSEQRKILKHIAVDCDTSMSDIIRQAIDNYIAVQPDSYVTEAYKQYLSDKGEKS